MEGPKIEWGRADLTGLAERWPKREDGQREPARFFCHCTCVDMEDRLLVNMLEAYGIPCLTVDPGDGGFGRVVLGMSGQGVDIYVPENLYDDAVALSKEENNEEL
jgi:hypothetical protein